MPAFTGAWHVRTVVKPSISVLNGATAGSWKSLFTKSWGLEFGVVPNGLPLLIVLIDTRAVPVVTATVAQFAPLTKNANTSSNSVFTYSLYSSDANTY